MRKFLILFNIIAISVLSGCGYKLAGKADLDPIFESSHVSYQGQGAKVAELLEKQLKVNQVALVSKEQASVLVDVLYEKKEREILSVDEDGKVREYELILQVGVDVKNADGVKLMQDQNIRLTRDFLFDINNVLGKGSEEEEIYQEMREDAARLIIYRLQAISSEPIKEEEK